MVDRSMQGLFPILSMPFDAQGRVDVEDLQREVEYTIDVGVDGLGVAFGSEINKLSEAERHLVTTTVVGQARDRVPVVINTGAQATDVAVEYSRRAEELGANAVMLTPPVGASGELVREYFGRVSEAVSVPVFIQDAGVAPMSSAVAAQISGERANVCYAKVETSPPPVRVAEWVEAGGEDLIVFGGASGGYIIEEMRRGSVGTMPHCAYLGMFRNVLDLFDGGREDEAVQEFNRHTPVLRSPAAGLWGTKEILRLKGVFKAVHVRHPAAPPDDFTWREFRSSVDALGLAEPWTG